MWHPNVQKKHYYSDILGTRLKLRVTTAAMRCIDKAGGLDAYIYHTPDHKLNSRLGIALKQRMQAIVKKYPDVDPPVRVRRYPRPARYLESKTESSEQRTQTTDLDSAAKSI